MACGYDDSPPSCRDFMAATEKRLPRDTFTKKLHRMCERLDTGSTQTLSFKHWYFDRAESATCTVTSLWVIGSYARGALECGDLDVVVSINIQGSEPPQRLMMKTFFGAPAYVRCYSGTPEKNTSGIALPNAVSIWTEPGCDWREAIASIAPNPSAGRARRAIDAIPFRTEQLHANVEELKDLLKLRREGLIEWSFIQFNQQFLSPLATGDFLESEEYIERFIKHKFAGRGILRLLHPIAKVMRKLEPGGSWDSDFGNRTEIWCDGTLLYLGNPSLPIHRLDGDAKLRQLGIVPHISSRGPNGIWLIRRGPNHADTVALVNIRAYYLASGGTPCIIHCTDFTEGRGREGEVLELFRTYEQAIAGAQEWQEILEPGDSDETPDVNEVRGADLLFLTSLCDIIQVDGKEIALTIAGCFLTGQEKASTIADVATLLSNVHR